MKLRALTAGVTWLSAFVLTAALVLSAASVYALLAHEKDVRTPGDRHCVTDPSRGMRYADSGW